MGKFNLTTEKYTFMGLVLWDWVAVLDYFIRKRTVVLLEDRLVRKMLAGRDNSRFEFLLSARAIVVTGEGSNWLGASVLHCGRGAAICFLIFAHFDWSLPRRPSN